MLAKSSTGAEAILVHHRRLRARADLVMLRNYLQSARRVAFALRDGHAWAPSAHPNNASSLAGRRALSAAAGPETKHALIQGSSRGLGLEIVRQLLQRPDHKCAFSLQPQSCLVPVIATWQLSCKRHATLYASTTSTHEGIVFHAGLELLYVSWVESRAKLTESTQPLPM